MSYVSKGLLAGMSVDALKARITTPPYDRVWAQLVHMFGRIVAAQDAAAPDYIGYGSLGSHTMTPGAIDGGLIHLLTGDRAALAYVERCIRALAAAYDLVPGKEHAIKSLHGLPYHAHFEVPLAADLCRDSLAPESRDLLHRVLREQVIDCHDNGRSVHMFTAGANIACARNINAAVAALVYGEEVDHPKWRRAVEVGRDSALGYFRRGMDSSGFPYEGPGYSGCMASHLYLIAQLLRQRGIEDLFADEPNTERFIDCMISLLFPDRSSHGNINDLGLMTPWAMPWALLTARYFNRPDHHGYWHESQGPAHPTRPYGDAFEWYERTYGSQQWTLTSSPPANVLTFLWWDAAAPREPLARTRVPMSLYASGTETAVFRTSWSPDAVHVSFLGTGRSHVSPGHIHGDCGHFNIFAHGEYLAIDTGRYNSDEDQHNVVLVDGKCNMANRPKWGVTSRTGRLDGFRRHAVVDYAKADMAHMKNCIWAQRHLMFVRAGAQAPGDDAYLFMMDNLNVDNGKHSYWWQLQTRPDCQIGIDTNISADIAGPRGRATIEAAKARLDVELFLPGADDFPKDPHTLSLRSDEAWWTLYPEDKGYRSSQFGLETSSVKRPRLIAEVTGLNGLIVALVMPRRAGAAPLKVTRRPHWRVIELEIVLDSGEMDTILAAPDCGLIDVPATQETDRGRSRGAVRAWTELLLIRRDASGGLKHVWTADGQPAWIDGVRHDRT